jgi:hypothetical protein
LNAYGTEEGEVITFPPLTYTRSVYKVESELQEVTLGACLGMLIIKRLKMTALTYQRVFMELCIKGKVVPVP